MKLYEALNSLQSEEEPYYGYGLYDNEFLQQFNLEEHHFVKTTILAEIGFTCRPIKTWMSSDTEVGYYAIYHDKELICVSYQLARTRQIEFQWVSKDVYDRIFNFLRSHISSDSDITLLDLNQEIN